MYYQNIRKQKKLYDYKAVHTLISYLIDHNYEICEIEEGCLVQGYTICVPPENGWYHYIIEEVYINEWTSGQAIRRRVKLSKADKKALDKYYESENE